MSSDDFWIESGQVISHNEDLIAAIVENMQLGRLDSCVNYCSILQANLNKLSSDVDTVFLNFLGKELNSNQGESSDFLMQDPFLSVVSADSLSRVNILNEMDPTNSTISPPIPSSCSECHGRGQSSIKCRACYQHIDPDYSFSNDEIDEYFKVAQILALRNGNKAFQSNYGKSKRFNKKWDVNEVHSLLIGISVLGSEDINGLAQLLEGRSPIMIKSFIAKNLSSEIISAVESGRLPTPPPNYKIPPALDSYLLHIRNREGNNMSSFASNISHIPSSDGNQSIVQDGNLLQSAPNSIVLRPPPAVSIPMRAPKTLQDPFSAAPRSFPYQMDGSQLIDSNSPLVYSNQSDERTMDPTRMHSQPGMDNRRSSTYDVNHPYQLTIVNDSYSPSGSLDYNNSLSYGYTTTSSTSLQASNNHGNGNGNGNEPLFCENNNTEKIHRKRKSHMNRENDRENASSSGTSEGTSKKNDDKRRNAKISRKKITDSTSLVSACNSSSESSLMLPSSSSYSSTATSVSDCVNRSLPSFLPTFHSAEDNSYATNSSNDINRYNDRLHSDLNERERQIGLSSSTFKALPESNPATPSNLSTNSSPSLSTSLPASFLSSSSAFLSNSSEIIQDVSQLPPSSLSLDGSLLPMDEVTLFPSLQNDHSFLGTF